MASPIVDITDRKGFEDLYRSVAKDRATRSIELVAVFYIGKDGGYGGWDCEGSNDAGSDDYCVTFRYVAKTITKSFILSLTGTEKEIAEQKRKIEYEMEVSLEVSLT